MHKVTKIFVYILWGLAIIAFLLAFGCLLEALLQTDFYNPLGTATLFVLGGSALLIITKIINE